MFQPLDGPAIQGTISVNTTVPQLVKVGASAFDERKVITIQPIDGRIYVYFANDGENPNAATISSKGFIQYKIQKDSYEASHTQNVYILAVSGTVDVRIAERS